METISHEFDITLKKLHFPTRIKTDKKFAQVPNIRKCLLLAYQINVLIETNADVSLKTIAEWLGITYTRIKQISDLLYICPKIQEELLLGDPDYINHITERSMRPIAQEIDWQKQLLLWHNYLNTPRIPSRISLNHKYPKPDSKIASLD